jgi:hypothetical protein
LGRWTGEVAARRHTTLHRHLDLVLPSSFSFTSLHSIIIIIIIITRYDSDENIHGLFPFFSGVTIKRAIASYHHMHQGVFGGLKNSKGWIIAESRVRAKKDSEEEIHFRGEGGGRK